MAKAREFTLDLFFEKHTDGRYFIRCYDLPGFHMAGMDWDALRADLEPVIKDLLWHNSEIAVDTMRWVPTLSDIAHRLHHPSPEGKATYLVKMKNAA
jgi:predicted RNase H-like HicB family nuclease